jgi:tRNA modification GTPase
LAATETVYAPITLVGRAGVTAFRVSGPGTAAAVCLLTQQPLPSPRVAVIRRIRDPENGEEVDEGLVLWMPGPASFTGEDCAEFHLHGGQAVSRAMMTAFSRVGGLAPALPGQFSRQAFDNGRLDLTQAEAIADLVDAETDRQRLQARRQLTGELGQKVEAWSQGVLRVVAHLEALIDFPDEDLPAAVEAAIAADMRDALASGFGRIRLREGLTVAIVGPPNVGKSSLLNALAGSDVAIVSHRAGTTLDTLEVHLNVDGWPVTLVDTAGLRETRDEIEQLGVARARRRIEEADGTICVLSPDLDDDPGLLASLLGRRPDLIVASKADLGLPLRHAVPEGVPMKTVSAKTGQGVVELTTWLAGHAAERVGIGGGAALLTRQRHVDAVQAAIEAIDRCRGLSVTHDVALMAEEMRASLAALGHITGRFGIEEILEVIFRDFCIGK